MRPTVTPPAEKQRRCLHPPLASGGWAGRRSAPGLNPWVRKIPWRREWQPIPILLPGEFHGQRSLAGYRGSLAWDHKESDATERLLNMPANLENSAVATELEKVSFHSYPKERQCQRMFKLPHNCTSHASKVMLKSLQARLQCPWDFSAKNIGMGCHSLLQGIFLTQGLNLCLLRPLHCRRILYC